MDINYLQDKLRFDKKIGSNSSIYVVDYTYQNCDHVLNQAFRFS